MSDAIPPEGVLHVITRGQITAAVVYFLVVIPMSKMMNRFSRPASEESAKPSSADLLTEIRDLPKLQRQPSSATRPVSPQEEPGVSD